MARVPQPNRKKEGRGLFILLLLALAFYGICGVLTDLASQHYLPAIIRSGAKSGVEISQVSFQNPGLASPVSVKWESVAAHLKPFKTARPGHEYSLTIDRLELNFSGFLDGYFSLKASNMSLSQLPAPLGSGKPEPREVKSIQGQFLYQFKIDPLTSSGVVQAIRKATADLSRLIREGRSEARLEYRGTSYFTLRGTRFFAELYTVREGENVRLVMSADNVERIAMQLDEDLTPAEVLLISRNPVRAPRLFAIKEYSKKKAAEAAQKDAAIPEDAYKHVLWSYLLTKEYDAAFAKEVTDAHEEGARKNTEADHMMDFQNNVVGSRYALEGVDEKDVLSKLLKDPAVVFKAEKTSRKN